MKGSKFFSLDWKDFFKGLVVAVFSAFITFLYEAIQAGEFWNLETLKKGGLVAVAALLAYLLKNLLTNSTGEPLAGEK
jgi:hypothetical protein